MSANLVGPESVYIKPIQSRTIEAGRRWYVKWKVAQRERTKTFKTRSAAVAFHAELVAATGSRGRSMWDPSTGKPVSWGPPAGFGQEPTFLELAVAAVERRWDEWTPNNRMSRVESMAQLLVYATSTPAKDKEMVRLVLRNWVLPKRAERDPLTSVKTSKGRTYTPDELERAITWIQRTSWPLSESTDLDVVHSLLKKAANSVVTGKPLGHWAQDKNRGSASIIFEEAIWQKHLQFNPVRQVRLKPSTTSTAVEPSAVPTPEQAREIVDALGTISARAVLQYRAFFTTMWSCGTRPSELYGLKMGPDLWLPDSGWGLLVLREPLVGSSSRWTDDRRRWHVRDGLKARESGSVRKVLVPPETVRELRAHLEATKPSDGDLVFQNSKGKPLDQSHVGRIWRTCLKRACDGRFTITVYELRHTSASVMLRAGVPAARAAQQLGNSVPMLNRTYSRVMSSDDDDFKESMDIMLRSS